MKQKLIIIILFIVFLALPQTFRSQTNSKPQKASKSSKPKIDKGKLEAKKIIEQFINGVFVERKVVEAFERFVMFEACDAIDVDAHLIQGCFFPEFPKGLSRKTNSRLSTFLWKSGFEAFYYFLGNNKMAIGDIGHPFSSSEYDKIEAQVLKKTKYLAPKTELSKLSESEIEKQLSIEEKNYELIERIVFARIDHKIYRKNIRLMKSTIKVVKSVENDRTYYDVEFSGFISTFILSRKNGELKIIGLADDI
jgi:hypothetical protein